jgi:ubiquinone/menaquinone biosynthesis C-methylase UbiE
MPTIEDNRRLWDGKYAWADAGEEWSAAWGGAESQWFGTIFPRVHAFLPTQTILEIAPGFGRWTNYLQGHCKKLIGVDLSTRCVEECRRRFGSRPETEFYVNDGTSLAMIPDHSVNFVFSCDSLVHVEADVIAAYLRQIARKFVPNGVGIIHHSNVGAYVDPSTGRLPLSFENNGWRAPSMTADVFRELCESAGLLCVGQEIINWWGSPLSDCFSVFTLPGSQWARPHRLVVNDHFMEEAHALSQIMQLYTSASFEKGNVSAAATVHKVTWLTQSSSQVSAKRVPFVIRWYRWWKLRHLPGPRVHNE